MNPSPWGNNRTAAEQIKAVQWMNPRECGYALHHQDTTVEAKAAIVKRLRAANRRRQAADPSTINAEPATR